jgi:hypothetical protein
VRTTIEIKPEHHARLLEIAAARGHSGISTVVAEAIEFFLRNEEEKERDWRSACGSLSHEEGEELRERALRLRHSWR